MDDEYIVDEYIKPTVKRNTYDKSDDHYISEQDEGSESENKSESDDEVDDSEYKKSNGNPEESEAAPKVSKERKEFKKKNISNESTKQLVEPVRSSCRLIIHVSNLSEETTKSMLEDFFSDAGLIKSVRIPKKRGTNNFAFVEMKDMEGFKNALKYDGRELDSKNIRVQEGSKNKKHSSKSKGKRKAPNNVKDRDAFKKRKFK